jgi:hypothetical protein
MKAFPYLQRKPNIFMSSLVSQDINFTHCIKGHIFFRFLPVLQGIIFTATICSIQLCFQICCLYSEHHNKFVYRKQDFHVCYLHKIQTATSEVSNGLR